MRLRGCTPSIDTVAAELKVSPRTLRRHLNDEGLGYQQLLNDFRVDMAREYLRSESMTPKEIAYLLGFKAWTGKRVQEYRAEL